MSESTVQPSGPTTEAVADRALGYLSGAAVAGLVYVGDQLGLYRAMRGAGPVSSAALAQMTGLNERWVREWLHAQASAGLVQSRGNGTFELTAEQAAVLADENDPAFTAGGFALVMPLLSNWERLRDAFTTGHGPTYELLGEDHARGESRFSAPWMKANLVSTILPALSGVVDKLRRGARAADIGCGSGAAIVEMARAFPRTRFDGFDSSRTALSLAGQRLQAGRHTQRFAAPRRR